MSKSIIILAIVCVFAMSTPPVSAGLIFSEDFESYAPGSNLSGQGGWVGDMMSVNNGSYLTGSKVLDGRDDIGTNTFSTSRKGLGDPLSSSSVSTLTFDAYATSSVPITHATGVGLDNTAGGSSVIWWAVKDTNGLMSWSFEISGLLDTSAYVRYAGGYDEVVSMSIVVDGIANEVYGIYDYGSGGTGETPHYSVTDAQIEELNAVSINVDYRPPTTSTQFGDTYAGGEFDNIVVIPEPGTVLLLGLGGLLLRNKNCL